MVKFSGFGKWFDDNNIDGYHLDKDIKVKGNKVYSPDTCLFVSHKDNNIESRAKFFKFINPQGEIVEIYNLSKFCSDSGLSRSNMSGLNSGKYTNVKGWLNL